MPAPQWFFRFMYDRESQALERLHDQPGSRDQVERVADEMADVVTTPGPIADLGWGPGIHTVALARRGYQSIGIDYSLRMVDVAKSRAARNGVTASFDAHDVSAPLPFESGSLGGVLAIPAIQHLPLERRTVRCVGVSPVQSACCGISSW